VLTGVGFIYCLPIVNISEMYSLTLPRHHAPTSSRSAMLFGDLMLLRYTKRETPAAYSPRYTNQTSLLFLMIHCDRG
jgi:hypothetical protein